MRTEDISGGFDFAAFCLVIITSHKLSEFSVLIWPNVFTELCHHHFTDEKVQRSILLGAVLETRNISETNT